MVETAAKSLNDLACMTEAQLEDIINREPANADNARYMLGKLLIEGTNPENVARNEKKGINWIKTAVKNGHMAATEFKVYYDIRFAAQPDLKKIEQTLLHVAEKGHSSRAYNTLAEFAHAQNKKDGFKEEAAKFYNKSQEMGCLIGTHWMGVFYQEGFGVSRNLDKAIELLQRAAKMGNAQSDFQLFLLYSREEEKKNPVLAYKHLSRAVAMGITFFDQMQEYFKDNYEALAESFLKIKKPSADPTKEVRQEVINLHEAHVHELKTNFMAALGRDRMYKRPCGSVTDQQIWMIGVLVKYFIKQVLHFNHSDFITALREDVGPLLGNTGIWALQSYQQR